MAGFEVCYSTQESRIGRCPKVGLGPLGGSGGLEASASS